MATKVKPRNTRQQMLDKLEEKKIRDLLDKAETPTKSDNK